MTVPLTVNILSRFCVFIQYVVRIKSKITLCGHKLCKLLDFFHVFLTGMIIKHKHLTPVVISCYGCITISIPIKQIVKQVHVL